MENEVRKVNCFFFFFFFEVKGRNFIDEKKYKNVTTESELLIRAKFYPSNFKHPPLQSIKTCVNLDCCNSKLVTMYTTTIHMQIYFFNTFLLICTMREREREREREINW